MRKLTMDELDRLSVEDYKTAPKHPFVLVLDNVRSMNNVGSIFRTADAFRAERLYLCGITGQPPHREITKTALGADESVDWAYVSDAADCCAELQRQGYHVVAIEQVEGSVSLADFAPGPDQKYAFVLGNEVFGVTEAVVERADACLEIPQFGTKHSLNVAVSAGIICWHWLSRFNSASKK